MNESQAKDLGRLITKQRILKGVSLREFAFRVHINPARQLRLERGVYMRPSVDKLIEIASLLDIDPEEINRTTGGYLAARLPEVRTYFRAKHGTGYDKIDRIEKLINEPNQRQPED